MKWQRFVAVARKEFIHVLRDWRSLVLAIAIPMLLIALFGYALTMDLKHVPTAVWDRSQSAESRELVSLLDGSAYFSVDHATDNYRDLGDMLDAGRIMVALVIPADFSDRVRAGRPVSIQALIDGADANNATLAAGYLDAVSTIYNSRLKVVRRSLQSGTGRITLEPRAWYNPEMESRNVIIPGIIALVMVVIAAMLTSVTIAREWETGTMEQLISTPIRVPELVLGKVVPYFVIGLADVAIAVAMGHWIYGVPLRGSTALLFLSASVFLTGALFLGLLLSINLKSQVLANQIALFTGYLPTLLLSGFVFGIYNMPVAIQAITFIVPARYFIALLRGIFLKGIGLEILALNMVLLTIYAAVMVLLCHRRMKLKL
ncbi:membrane protein [Desulfosarcina ovata subsp. sediminis]|uniref:Membrane protein n=1 Tax=Desulfosarcina ovata subsp. sediminis TaxID=885957 RepID=A0A5K7ZZK6_9BACT|nr:ABC transporter permease [Desulfosarcina ovata]BBO85697.1 membrane protein [Desulfosarcina ovata subsp. sediminis]